MKKVLRILVLTICLFTNQYTYAAPFEYRYSKHWKYVYHKHNEASYQRVWCALHNGIEEYENSDKTRIDCLTTTHAVEFDFADKYYEAVGQALYYGLISGKKPKIILILDKNKEAEQIVYVERIKKIGLVYNIDVEHVTEDILTVDNKNKCKYIECKCHKKGFFLFF